MYFGLVMLFIHVLDCFKSLRSLSALFLQANRARTALIQQIDAFFAGNGLDAFIGPSTNETSMGNVVGLPQMVIPVDFEPVALGSARQQPVTVGIYALPNQDSKVRPCLLVCLCLSASLLCQECDVSGLTVLLLQQSAADTTAIEMNTTSSHTLLSCFLML